MFPGGCLAQVAGHPPLLFLRIAMKYGRTPEMQCPFFLSYSRYSITCEGFVPGTATLTRFPTTEQRDNYMQEHCTRMPRETGCSYCRWLLREKY